MKKIIFLFSINFIIFVAAKAQNVGINTSTPKTSLDIKGGIRNQPLYLIGSGTAIIIPDNQSNINLTGNFSGQFSATINNPEDGQRLIIDNISNQTGVLIGGPDIRSGLNEYIFSDGEWKIVKMNAWDLNGNYNTNPATQFIGTTDKNDVIFKRFNNEKMRIAEEGLQIKEGNTLEFGAGTPGKQTDNGKIGYSAFGEANTLSIVGGGVSATGADRRIKLWADLGTDFTGGASFNKNVQIKNNLSSMLALTNTNALAAGSTHLLSFGGTNYTTGLMSVTGTSASAARMGFSTGYSFTGGVSNMQERLSIANNGNIGIGKIAPTSKLDVLGDINTTGLIKLSDVSGTAGQVLTSNGATAPTWANQAFTNNIRFGVFLLQNATTMQLNYDEVYNTNPSFITINPSTTSASGDILVVKAGLYRINGSFQYSVVTSSLPSKQIPISLDLVADGFVYTIAVELEIPRVYSFVNFIFRTSKEFSFDVYMKANTKIRFNGGINLTEIGGVLSRSYTGRVSGYLISE